MVISSPLERLNASHRDTFRKDVIQGLRMPQKTLPSKYFYDQRGSELFDQICELPEYYPTRTEVEIMRQHAAEIGERIGPNSMIIELGSGSSMKTSWLLENTPRPVAYVPVDICREHLAAAAARIAKQFVEIEVAPICADFSTPFLLPVTETRIARRVVYFPGSTIGNFRPESARQLLKQMAKLVGKNGAMVIGYDLDKDPRVLERAYDDAAKVTAEFNKNLLRRINNELDADFAMDKFHHRALYNPVQHRVEMHLVSGQEQRVAVDGEEFDFASGESIRTELSHKYRINQFGRLAQAAGFGEGTVWTDPQQQFAVGYYPVAS
ncbi:L-histidine N(alpha)-methyltransferase [Aeoliella sp. SH292]|uniref:L-histidine N(alpha)-methyltransferase n=1 Tax=Aeoliella sp. SH292 TaxID=3454464 RepID=UPI003F9A0D0D